MECLRFCRQLFKLFCMPRGGLVLCRPVRVRSCVHVACSCPFQGRHAQSVWKSLARPWGKTVGMAWRAQVAGDENQPSQPGPALTRLRVLHVLMAFLGFMVTEFFSLVPPSQPLHPPRNGLKPLPNLLIRILKSLARVPSFPCST